MRRGGDHRDAAETDDVGREGEQVEAEIARSSGSPRGRLRINTSNAFGVHQLAPALPQFFVRYPQIEIELSIADRIVDLVAADADVIIRAGRIADMSVSVRKIATFARTICAAPSYLARRGTPSTPADLASHDCILTSVPTSSHWPFRTPSGVEYVEIAPRVSTDNGEAALRLALSGSGIVRLADVIVGEQVHRGLLVPLLTDIHYVEAVPLSALYLPGRNRLPKVRAFLDFLVEQFACAPWRI